MCGLLGRISQPPAPRGTLPAIRHINIETVQTESRARHTGRLIAGSACRSLETFDPASGWARMEDAQTYLERAKAPDEYADRCVSGSEEQRQFHVVAEQRRSLARPVTGFSPLPDESGPE